MNRLKHRIFVVLQVELLKIAKGRIAEIGLVAVPDTGVNDMPDRLDPACLLKKIGTVNAGGEVNAGLIRAQSVESTNRISHGDGTVIGFCPIEFFKIPYFIVVDAGTHGEELQYFK
jgi:hypothetical protein